MSVASPSPLFVHISNARAEDHLESSIWSSAEPSIAIISACLPTVRPLLRAATPLLYSFSSIFRSQGSFRRRKYRIQLESIGGGEYRAAGFSERADWASKSHINQPASAVTRNTITAFGTAGHDPERDDMLLSEINVQHEVSVIRSGR